jgi:uncharacterized protein
VVPLAAQRQGIDRLFPEQPTGYVNDLAGVIEPEREAAMTAMIERLRRATGAEIAVVSLPTIGSYDRADVALAIGRKWGVGAAAEQGDSRRNAGLVVLLVPRTDSTTGQIFISTGRGIEGIVTDAIAGRIRDRMVPHFRSGRYGEGLEVGLRTIVATVAQGFGITDTTLVGEDRSLVRPRGAVGRRLSSGAVLGLVLVIFLFALFAARSSTRPTRGFRGRGRRGRRRPNDWFIWPPGGWGGGGWGGGSGSWGGGGGGGGFAGFGGGGGFSGGGAGGDF